jgi:hypothetical protein
MNNCLLCNKKFIRTDIFRKYCSKNCKIKAQKEKKPDYDKIYYQKNKYKINQQRKKYRNQRLQKDIDFKIRRYLSHRIYMAVKGYCKSETTIKLLGCSVEQLKKHLEKQFKLDMNWSNYGKWHVDHINPCASFDLSKTSEQKKCFNYTNLQPLWAEENLRKNKY